MTKRGFGNKITTWIFIGLVGLLACSPALYLPTPELAQQKNKPIGNLNLGRHLYIDHCGSCHRLYLPAQFSGQAWHAFVDTMQPRAKISDSQKQLILDYILSGK